MKKKVKKLKGLLKNILLSALTTIVFLGLLEISARALNTTLLKETLTETDIRTKFEQAFIPPFLSKDKDTLRVFVYGGSTVQGLPLSKVGFVPQLDHLLHQAFGAEKKVEITNFGWSGHNSTMIRFLISRTVSKNPDLLVVFTGHNEFIYPQLDSYHLIRTLTLLKNRSGLAKMLLTLKNAGKEKIQDLDEPIDKKRSPYRKTKLFYPLKMLLFRQNMQAIAKTARHAGVPLILCTAPSNLADWPPFERGVTTLTSPKDYQPALEKAKALTQQESLQEAEKLIDSTLLKHPLDSPLLFLKAQIASKSGQSQQARYFYIKAKDHDLIPWRTTIDQNDFIRSLEDKKTVWVADVEKEFFSHSPDDLPGFPLIIDNVHPTKEGNYLIARTILDLIKKEKMTKQDWWKDAPNPLTLAEFLKKIKFSPQDEFEIYFETARYSMKSPFFQLEIAQNYLDKAEEIDNQTWETKALNAGLAFLQEDEKKAKTFLFEALKINRFPLRAHQILEIPYLSQFIPPKQ